MKAELKLEIEHQDVSLIITTDDMPAFILCLGSIAIEIDEERLFAIEQLAREGREIRNKAVNFNRITPPPF